MNFVDEKNFALFERGEKPGEIGGFFDDGTGSDFHFRAHFLGENERERRLAETGRTVQQNVVERAMFPPRRADHHAQALNRARLSREIVEIRRAQRLIERRVLARERFFEITARCVFRGNARLCFLFRHRAAHNIAFPRKKET